MFSLGPIMPLPKVQPVSARGRLERDPGEGLRRLHALDRSDFRHHDGSNRVVGISLDLRDEVVFPEQRIQFDNLSDLHQHRVDLLLVGRLDVDQDETDRREGTPQSRLHLSRR